MYVVKEGNSNSIFIKFYNTNKTKKKCKMAKFEWLNKRGNQNYLYKSLCSFEGYKLTLIYLGALMSNIHNEVCTVKIILYILCILEEEMNNTMLISLKTPAVYLFTKKLTVYMVRDKCIYA